MLVVAINQQTLVHSDQSPSLAETLVEPQQILWNPLRERQREWEVLGHGKQALIG